MAQQAWRRKIFPECRWRVQEAVAQLRAVGLRVELSRDDWLVFDLDDTHVDHRAVETLDRIWPHWRDCVSDQVRQRELVIRQTDFMDRATALKAAGLREQLGHRRLPSASRLRFAERIGGCEDLCNGSRPPASS